MNAYSAITPALCEAADNREARAGKMTYAEAAMIVAAERGPRPIVRVPVSTTYSGLSNEARFDEAMRMFDGITAREEWDRAVKRVLACPVAASVDHMHAIAAGERRSAARDADKED